MPRGALGKLTEAARLLYSRPPSEEELAGTGLSVEDYAEEAEIWPENLPAFELFSLMRTQWDAGMGGAAGLKYPVLFELMDRRGIAGDDWWQTLDDVRAMEAAALEAMRG